jgi:hypothetical protein
MTTLVWGIELALLMVEIDVSRLLPETKFGGFTK